MPYGEGQKRMSDERCKHDQVKAWCGESECMAERKGLPVRVWRTSGGHAFHRRPDCDALGEGQLRAKKNQHETHDVKLVPLSVAMSDRIGDCFHCFPPGVPADAKPCDVLVGGRWAQGLLIGWEQAPDGRWKGTVNYRRYKSERAVVTKDESELRPAPNAL